MVMAALLLAMWHEPTQGQFIDGMATYYAPGLMERVAHNRQMDLTDYAGGVALNRRADLGRVVWLEYHGEVSGPYLVVDCAQRGHDFEERERKGLVVEVSWEVAQAWEMTRPVTVRVWLEEPERLSSGGGDAAPIQR